MKFRNAGQFQDWLSQEKITLRHSASRELILHFDDLIDNQSYNAAWIPSPYLDLEIIHAIFDDISLQMSRKC